jgi:hypothetical protein
MKRIAVKPTWIREDETGQRIGPEVFALLGAIEERRKLTEAAEAGTARIRVKMDQAVQLAGLFGAAEVDAALGHAGVHGRFAETDLASILDHRATRPAPGTRQAGETTSLTQGTAAWSALGHQPHPGPKPGHDQHTHHQHGTQPPLPGLEDPA